MERTHARSALKRSVEAPDGSIWWTGMWASLTGRLDPIRALWRSTSSSSSAAYRCPGYAGQYLVYGNSNATVGKLNPATGEVTEYKTEAVTLIQRFFIRMAICTLLRKEQLCWAGLIRIPAISPKYRLNQGPTVSK